MPSAEWYKKYSEVNLIIFLVLASTFLIIGFFWLLSTGFFTEHPDVVVFLIFTFILPCIGIFLFIFLIFRKRFQSDDSD